MLLDVVVLLREGDPVARVPLVGGLPEQGLNADGKLEVVADVETSRGPYSSPYRRGTRGDLILRELERQPLGTKWCKRQNAAA